MQIIELASIDAPEAAVFTALNEKQLYTYYEPENGIFIAESPNVILRALDDGYQPEAFLMDRRHIGGQAAELLSRCPETPVYTASHEMLSRITGFELTRGILCSMRRRPLPPMEEICRGAHRIAILENVVNPTNVGAIFRSAAALGMDAVLLTPGCADPLYRRAARVSMGTVFQIPWTYIDFQDRKPTPEEYRRRNEEEKAKNTPTGGRENNMLTGGKEKNPPADKKTELPLWPDRGMEFLRQSGFKTAAMALRDDSVSIDDAQLAAEEKLAVILGTEGDGLADATIADCDYTVRIPMLHGVDSLNVAAASAVAFWQLRWTGGRQYQKRIYSASR